MYQDDPDWQVLFNLLRGLYKNNPVRIDIAGTVESIAEINAELLYSCYRTFYNNSNMCLAVAGNVKAEDVIAIADRVLKAEEPVTFEQIVPQEPYEVATSYIEEKLGVESPKFAIGFKEKCDAIVPSPKKSLLYNLALEIIAGKFSPLYTKLLDEGLINTSFGKEYFYGRGFASVLFSGESKEPEKVKEEILKEITRIKNDGISKDDFEICLKKKYGAEIYAYNDVNDLANNLCDAWLNYYGIFDTIELYKTITKEDVEAVIKDGFDTENVCLSVIK